MRLFRRRVLPALEADFTLQSPEGDWADCDLFLDELSTAAPAVQLQPPEGDWADCDPRWTKHSTVTFSIMRCNPLKGIGLIATDP